MRKPGRKKKKKKARGLEVQRGGGSGLLAVDRGYESGSSSSESEDDACPSASVPSKGRQRTEELEALVLSIEEPRPTDKFKKKKRKATACVPTPLPEHSETQLYEIITIDSLYPHSLSILDYGWLDQTNDLLMSIEGCQEWGSMTLEGTELLFCPFVDDDAPSVKYHVVLATQALTDNPLRRHGPDALAAGCLTLVAPNQRALACLEVRYSPRYPETPPMVRVRFSFALPAAMKEEFTRDITALLLETDGNALQLQRIVPICERTVGILSEWDARDSALWEQMQSRHEKRLLSTGSSLPCQRTSGTLTRDRHQLPSDICEPSGAQLRSSHNTNDDESFASCAMGSDTSITGSVTSSGHRHIRTRRLSGSNEGTDVDSWKRRRRRRAFSVESDSSSAQTQEQAFRFAGLPGESSTELRDSQGPTEDQLIERFSDEHAAKSMLFRQGRQKATLWNMLDVQAPIDYITHSHSTQRYTTRRLYRRLRANRKNSALPLGRESLANDHALTAPATATKSVPIGNINPSELRKLHAGVHSLADNTDDKRTKDDDADCQPLLRSESARPSVGKDTLPCLVTVRPLPARQRLSRYAKDFDELEVLGHGLGHRQVVTKVRHRIDLNIYVVKRIAWPQVVPVANRSTDSPMTTAVSSKALSQLGRCALSSEILSSQSVISAQRADSAAAMEYISTATASTGQHDSPPESRGIMFSADLYRRVMFEISRLSHLQHENVARVFQGWVQRVFPDEHPPLLRHDLWGELSHDSSYPFPRRTVSASRPTMSQRHSANPLSTAAERVLCVQMECCTGTTLRSLIDNGNLGSREQRKVWDVFRQLLDVLVVLHDEKLYHRALHPGNIFVDTSDQLTVKVGDFGLANLIHRETAIFRYSSRCPSSRCYVGETRNCLYSLPSAPDILLQRHSMETFPIPAYVRRALCAQAGEYLPEEFFSGSLLKEPVTSPPKKLSFRQDVLTEATSSHAMNVIDEKADVFALGLILFEMLCPPFSSPGKRQQALTMLINREYTQADLANLVGATGACTLIQRLTNPEPLARPSVSDLLYNETLVPSALPKSMMKQFLHRLESPVTGESSTVLSLMLSRQLDPTFAARFFEVRRFQGELVSQKLTRESVYRPLGGGSLLGVDMSYLSSPCVPQPAAGSVGTTLETVRPLESRYPSGFFFNYLMASLGLDGVLLQIAVARDFVWQTVEKTFSGVGAQLADLAPLRLGLASCDCGLPLNDSFKMIDTEPLKGGDTPSLAKSEPGRICWRSAIVTALRARHATYVERSPSAVAGEGGVGRLDIVAAQKPYVLLDVAGAVVSLAADLTNALTSFCAALLGDRRPSKGPLQLPVDVPPCFRLYAIRSTYRDGPFYTTAHVPACEESALPLTRGISSISPSADHSLASSKEPGSSLRAVFNVVVGLDAALRDSLWDVASLQSNLLVLQAEHILTVVDSVLPLAPFVGRPEVIWSHTDLLQCLLLDICHISDTRRLNTLDLYIRLFCVPKDLITLRYVLFLAPLEDLETAILSGNPMESSHTNQDALDAAIQAMDPADAAETTRNLKLWRVAAKEFRNLVKCLTCCQGGCCASHANRTRPVTQHKPCRAVRCKELIISSHHHLAMKEFQEVFAVARARVSAAFNAFEDVTVTTKALPNPEYTATAQLLRQLILAESTFEISRDFDVSEPADVKMLQSVADVAFVFNITLNYDRCVYNTNDSLVFHLFMHPCDTNGHQFCAAVGGRHDDLVERHLDYRHGLSSAAARTTEGPAALNNSPVEKEHAQTTRHVAAVLTQLRQSAQHTFAACTTHRPPLLSGNHLKHAENRTGIMAFVAELDLERLAEEALTTECCHAFGHESSTPRDSTQLTTTSLMKSSLLHAGCFTKSLTKDPRALLLDTLNPAVVIVAQKHHHEVQGFNLLEKITSRLHLRSVLRVCPIWDLPKFRERLSGSSIFCLVVLQQKSGNIVSRGAPKEMRDIALLPDAWNAVGVTTGVESTGDPASPRLHGNISTKLSPRIMPHDTADSNVSYRVEFFTSDPQVSHLLTRVVARGTRQSGGVTRSQVKVDTENEVLQIIGHTLQRLSR